VWFQGAHLSFMFEPSVRDAIAQTLGENLRLD